MNGARQNRHRKAKRVKGTCQMSDVAAREKQQDGNEKDEQECSQASSTHLVVCKYPTKSMRNALPLGSDFSWHGPTNLFILRVVNGGSFGESADAASAHGSGRDVCQLGSWSAADEVKDCSWGSEEDI